MEDAVGMFSRGARQPPPPPPPLARAPAEAVRVATLSECEASEERPADGSLVDPLLPAFQNGVVVASSAAGDARQYKAQARLGAGGFGACRGAARARRHAARGVWRAARSR